MTNRFLAVAQKVGASLTLATLFLIPNADAAQACRLGDTKADEMAPITVMHRAVGGDGENTGRAGPIWQNPVGQLLDSTTTLPHVIALIN